MAQDKFGGMELGLINTDDLKVKSFKDLKSLWEQAEKLGWKGPEECILPRQLPDSAQPRIEIDTTDMPNPRYHDRTFPKHYDKKKRAKRRQQKHSRRRH